MRHKKVKFKGEEYWWHDDLLSPIDHYTDNGELLADPFTDISYAVIEGKNILRFHEKIGTIEDLIEV